MEKKKKKWLKFRHRVVRNVAYLVIAPMVWLKYRVKITKFARQGDRKYLILFNHQTAFDQFIVGMAFRGPVYYLASEDLFSMGFLSRLLQWAVAPIPIKKQTNDPKAVYNCIRVAREGGTIALSPEGNRTYGGRTGYMKPSVVKLVRAIKLPLALYRIEGGYGVHPRWSDVIRKGTMRGYVSRVIEPEEMKAMTDSQLMALIEQELWQDEAQVSGEFHHQKNAEFLERVFYVCPECGLTTFESHNDIIRCTKCGTSVRHKPTKELEGIGKPFPHRFVAGWYEWQNDYVNHLDTASMTDAPIWQERGRFSRVHAAKRKELLIRDASICLYGDRITVDGRDFPFATTDVTLLGKNKLNLYAGKEIFQIKSCKRFNALKYLNFYHRFKNLQTGDKYEFLGL